MNRYGGELDMIGIIGAMEEEVAKLIEEMELQETIECAAMEFHKGILCGKDVVVVKSGIGKVNAAACTQILVDRFAVDMLINTGVAGSLDARIDIGDIVISSDSVNHDMDAVEFGYPIGQVPRMDTLAFPADVKLVELAKEINEEVNTNIKTFVGRVASGDQFIGTAEAKDKIISNFETALCAEMEGAAIAQVAYLNQVSYVIIRAISDKADNSATMDFPTFAKSAIVHTVSLVSGLLERL